MSGLAGLPDEVLKLVMQLVPLRDRLCNCCLVSRRLHAAAVAGTQELKVDFGPYAAVMQRLGCGPFGVAPQRNRFYSWLSHYGHYLTSLYMEDVPQSLDQLLPCPNLLKLALVQCHVQLGPCAASGTPGIIAGCTKLIRLDLLHDIISTPGEGLLLDGSLSNLLDLQHLEMQPRADDTVQDHYVIGGFIPATLPCLTRLTHLTTAGFSVENLSQLGALTNLRVLSLTAAVGVTIGPSSAPALVFPASLTQLVLRSPVEARVLSLVPAGLKVLEVNKDVEGPDEGPGSLLSCMAGLQELEQLSLWFEDWPAAGPGYSALTASSSLVSLGLRHVHLPQGVWPHVFPDKRQLLHLTNLTLLDPYEGQDPIQMWDVVSRWATADMCSLVRCCPNLCKIEGMHLQHGWAVTELCKLMALTSLGLHYAVGHYASAQESLWGLAALTQLSALDVIMESQSLVVTALLPLTSLTNLSLLQFSCPDDDDEEEHLDVGLVQEAPFPDVWLQLLEQCAEDRDAQHLVLRSVAQQLAEQMALAAQQQRELTAQQLLVSDQQRQISDLRSQLSEQKAVAMQQLAQQRAVVVQQQQQIAGLQDTMSAQQQVVAGQGVLITGLHDQLRELCAELHLLRQQAHQ